MPSSKQSTRGPLSFDDVREIALSMPDVEETTAYGMPAFKAGKTRFAGKPVERSEIEPNTLGVSVSFEVRDALLAARPDVYYVTRHFANYPAARDGAASPREKKAPYGGVRQQGPPLIRESRTRALPSGNLSDAIPKERRHVESNCSRDFRRAVPRSFR